MNQTKISYLFLAAAGLLSLALRIWMLDQHWINADEGAHMMDAVLALEGKVPFVDFTSRQPIYTYSLAAAFKILGVHYISGRLLVMMLSFLVSLPVFFLARILYNERIAILSTVVYLLLPLEILNSVVVKTEPLSMMIMSLSFLMLALFTRQEKTIWLFSAGALAATGYYVRQSALVVPLAAVLFLTLYGSGHPVKRLKHMLYFLVGYGLVVMAIGLFYLQFLDLGELVQSDLNPLIFVLKSFNKILLLLGIAPQTTSTAASQIPVAGQDQYQLYFKYIRQALSMHLFLVAGMLFVAVWEGYTIFIQKKAGFKNNRTLLLYLWVFLLATAYAYYFRTRGFYIDYFREFFPPLVILFSAGLYYGLSAVTKDEDNIGFLAIIGGLALFIFITIVKFKGIIPTKAVMLGFLVIYAAIVFRKWKYSKAGLRTFPAMAAIGIVIVFFGYNLTYMANRLSIRYDANWSPAAVEKAAAYIRENSSPEETVLSGAVIWELQAHRKPFANISHPLEFEFDISEERRSRLESEIRKNPPKIIVMDAFIEKTYLKQFPWLANFIKTDYILGVSAKPARLPVDVYKLIGP